MSLFIFYYNTIPLLSLLPLISIKNYTLSIKIYCTITALLRIFAYLKSNIHQKNNKKQMKKRFSFLSLLLVTAIAFANPIDLTKLSKKVLRLKNKSRKPLFQNKPTISLTLVQSRTMKPSPATKPSIRLFSNVALLVVAQLLFPKEPFIQAPLP